TQCARQIDKQHACVALVEIRIENKSAVGNRNQPARTDLQVYGKGLTAGREPYPPVGISLVEMGQAGNWNRPRRGREVALDRTRVTAGRNGLLDIESLPLAVEAAHHHGSSPRANPFHQIAGVRFSYRYFFGGTQKIRSDEPQNAIVRHAIGSGIRTGSRDVEFAQQIV